MKQVAGVLGTLVLFCTLAASSRSPKPSGRIHVNRTPWQAAVRYYPGGGRTLFPFLPEPTFHIIFSGFL